MWQPSANYVPLTRVTTIREGSTSAPAVVDRVRRLLASGDRTVEFQRRPGSGVREFIVRYRAADHN